MHVTRLISLNIHIALSLAKHAHYKNVLIYTNCSTRCPLAKHPRYKMAKHPHYKMSLAKRTHYKIFLSLYKLFLCKMSSQPKHPRYKMAKHPHLQDVLSLNMHYVSLAKPALQDVLSLNCPHYKMSSPSNIHITRCPSR
ncbi:hypothetical protein AVEN_48790-1 [Araneus ventricosus]|uniref:Uncharacterized protein n=1 Tax=Araneus ventricosus TaxID=182803 RepID=A0A4Y2IFX3_ARAVE|nr:hypothetical protein AVEN_48790-1 [Araneus ventricosus]